MEYIQYVFIAWCNFDSESWVRVSLVCIHTGGM